MSRFFRGPHSIYFTHCMRILATVFAWNSTLWDGGFIKASTLTCRYLAVGGADAIVSLWDLNEWICVRTFDRQEYLRPSDP